jgi:hypothetical protein
VEAVRDAVAIGEGAEDGGADAAKADGEAEERPDIVPTLSGTGNGENAERPTRAPLSIADDPLVFMMRTDPEPIGRVASQVRQGAITGNADSNGPDLADFLEVK